MSFNEFLQTIIEVIFTSKALMIILVVIMFNASWSRFKACNLWVNRDTDPREVMIAVGDMIIGAIYFAAAMIMITIIWS